MKKVMQINITCGRGSTGKLAMALYNASIDAGYEARFAYSAYTPTLDTAFPIERRWQNRLRRGLNRFFGRKQSHSDFGTKRLIRYIKKERPDIIHLHNVQQNSVNYYRLFSFLKESNIPVVYTLHDCWPFTGGCFHYLWHNCEDYKNGCEKCPIKVHPDDKKSRADISYRAKASLIGENSNIKIYAVSNWLRDSASASYMGDMPAPPATIYNGIDTSVFCPDKEDVRAELGLSKDAFIVLGVADFWTEEKGLSLFYRLSEDFGKDGLVALVGDVKENDRKDGDIVFLGKTQDQRQLAKLYCAADVFVNASRFETFGMTTAEALACGTPAVVMNSTACPEVVDENTGIVIDGSYEDLFKAVQTVKNKGKKEYSAACVKRACEMFDINRMTKEYLEIYRNL